MLLYVHRVRGKKNGGNAELLDYILFNPILRFYQVRYGYA